MLPTVTEHYFYQTCTITSVNTGPMCSQWSVAAGGSEGRHVPWAALFRGAHFEGQMQKYEILKKGQVANNE